MIFLVEANDRYADEVEHFKEEVLIQDRENENRFAGCLGLEESASAREWIRQCILRQSEDTCGQTGVSVPSTTYFAIRESDCRLVGVIDLRHHIDHPVLGTWGGHCGYSVRPSERGHGYAKEMLRLNLQNAKAKGIPRILVTCGTDNPASEKTILANGGVFDKDIDVDGETVRRYWIVTDRQ